MKELINKLVQQKNKKQKFNSDDRGHNIGVAEKLDILLLLNQRDFKSNQQHRRQIEKVRIKLSNQKL